MSAAEMFFEWIGREMGIALTLGRHFHWFENVFPLIEEDGVQEDDLTDGEGNTSDETLIGGGAATDLPKQNGIKSSGDTKKPLRFFPKELSTVVFLSEQDCIVPTARIHSVLDEEADNFKVRVMPKLDHGGFLFEEYWLDTVLETLVRVGA